MKVDVNLPNLDSVLDTLKSLPAEIVSKRGGPVKLSLAKGARYLRDKVRANLKVAIARNGATESTGLLLENIIASRGKAPNSGKGERYLVRVKRRTYAVRRGKKATTTLQTANLMEYGSSNQSATPFIRPAVQTDGEATINVIAADLVKRVEKVVTALGAKNQGK